MAPCRPRVYVDERERGCGVPEKLRELGAVVYFERLSVADYIVSDRVAVERKTVEDLARSLFDGRLFDQARRLGEAYERPILLVEGRLERLEELTGRSLEVKLAVLKVELEYGLRLALSRDAGESASIIYRLAVWEQCESRRRVVLHRKPRLDSLWEQQLYVVQSLPGVGEALAWKLLEKFGSIEGICRASLVELERVLGYSRAARVYRVLHARFSPPRGRSPPPPSPSS